MPQPLDLAPAALIALAKQLPKLAAGVELEAGTYPVDVTLTLRVAGSLKRSPDTEYQPSVEVPYLELLACALERAGCGRHAAKSALEAALPEVLRGYTPRNPDRLRDLAETVDAFKAARKAEQPKQWRAGATTAQVVIERVYAGQQAA